MEIISLYFLQSTCGEQRYVLLLFLIVIRRSVSQNPDQTPHHACALFFFDFPIWLLSKHARWIVWVVREFFTFSWLSRFMRKQMFCICDNREADQRLCFRYLDSTIPLDSAVVSALACRRCDPGSNPGVRMWQGGGRPSKVGGFPRVLRFPSTTYDHRTPTSAPSRTRL